MSAPAPSKEAPAKQAGPGHDPNAAYVNLAERIFVQLSTRVYGTLSGTDAKKPDPKALATFSFKLADAFEAATKETDRVKATIEAANKAGVKLDEVDLSSVFAATKK